MNCNIIYVKSSILHFIVLGLIELFLICILLICCECEVIFYITCITYSHKTESKVVLFHHKSTVIVFVMMIKCGKIVKIEIIIIS